MRGISNLRTLALIVLAFPLITACGDKIDPLRAPVSPGDGTETVTYTSKIKAFFAQNCLLCHSVDNSGIDRNGAPPEVNFNSYELAAPLAERANLRIQSGTMPPTGGLPDADRILFQQWIDAGTPK